jgi:chaperonin GroES
MLKDCIRPLRDFIVVRPIEKATVTAGGLIVPDQASYEGIARGEVVSVGPGRYENGMLIPMNLNEGDMVMYNDGPGGIKMVINGMPLQVMKEYEAFAVVDRVVSPQEIQ